VQAHNPLIFHGLSSGTIPADLTGTQSRSQHNTQDLAAMKITTIQDVADRAGVSIKTVSRVANDAQDVRAETAARVRDAIDELNYRPNPQAIYLARLRSRSRAST
jgi:transcriptional regulator with XRE-family HTH domain